MASLVSHDCRTSCSMASRFGILVGTRVPGRPLPEHDSEDLVFGRELGSRSLPSSVKYFKHVQRGRTAIAWPEYAAKVMRSQLMRQMASSPPYGGRSRCCASYIARTGQVAPPPHGRVGLEPMRVDRAVDLQVRAVRGVGLRQPRVDDDCCRSDRNRIGSQGLRRRGSAAARPSGRRSGRRRAAPRPPRPPGFASPSKTCRQRLGRPGRCRP